MLLSEDADPQDGVTGGLSSTLWVLEADLGSSTRSVSKLNLGLISPVAILYFCGKSPKSHSFYTSSIAFIKSHGTLITIK